MTEKAIYLDDVRDKLVEWIDKHGINDEFDGAFIFGSLLNREGRHFVPQGSMASDVDLILTFDDAMTSAENRYTALKRIRDFIRPLEHETASVLKRATAEPIYSILPLTSYEIHQCIHKGHDPKLFMSNLFLEVRTGDRVEEGLASFVDYDYHFENLEAFASIRLCQNYRNIYLRGNQIGEFAQKDFGGETVFPKEIMRGAALLKYSDGKRDREDRRTDLEEGQTYLLNLLDEKSNDANLFKEMFERVTGRNFAKTKSKDLNADDMLLIHEIMFDKARELVIPSVRDAIREVIEAELEK